MKAPLKFIRAFSSLAFLLLAGASTATAQLVSVYTTFTTVRLHVPATIDPYVFGDNIRYPPSDYWANGVGGGVTLTPIHAGPLSLGLDLRGSDSRQKQGGYTLLAGIKAGFKLPLIPLKPYVQASGGYIGTHVTDTTAYPTTANFGFYAYEFLGGLDLAILPHTDLRLVEVGGGQGYFHSSNVSGNVGYYGEVSPSIGPNNINLFTVSTGVVLHF